MPFKPDQKHFLYRLTRFIIKSGLKIFFERLEVRHEERLPKTGPALVVANHPNSIMDALVLGTALSRKVNYIAHSGLFRPKLMRWFLQSCGVIPVYRRQDHPDKMEHNIQTFQACYEALERGETIGIFPEGTSDMRRKVKQVKTGAARIVLETEARNGYDLGVKLIPAGLHFFSRSHFHSRVLVNIGEAIPLVKFFTLFNNDPVAGANALTQEIQIRLERLTINIQNEELEDFVRDLEEIYRDELKPEPAAGRRLPQGGLEDFLIAQKIAECVQFYHARDPERVEMLRAHISGYKRKLARLRLQDNVLREGASAANMWKDSLRAAAMAIAGFPFALYGAINNFIPYHLAEYIAKKYLQERTKILTALLIAGGLFFLLFYALQTAAAAYFFGALPALIYALSLPLSGFWALSYLKRMREYRERMSFSLLLFTSRHLINRLRLERRRLLKAIDKARDEFLATRQQEKNSAPLSMP